VPRAQHLAIRDHRAAALGVRVDVVGMQLVGLLASAEHQTVSFASSAGVGKDFGTIRATESTDRVAEERIERIRS